MVITHWRSQNKKKVGRERATNTCILWITPKISAELVKENCTAKWKLLVVKTIRKVIQNIFRYVVNAKEKEPINYWKTQVKTKQRGKITIHLSNRLTKLDGKESLTELIQNIKIWIKMNKNLHRFIFALYFHISCFYGGFFFFSSVIINVTGWNNGRFLFIIF